MPHLMILNPRHRAKKHRRHHRRKMTAKQLKYFGKRRRAGRRVARRTAPKVVELAVNPRRRRRRGLRRYFGKKRRHSFRANPRRRFRRNPIGLGNLGGMLKTTVVPATIGGLGALGVDYVMANLMPASLTTGVSAPLLRIAAAFALGMAAGTIAGKSFGEQVTAGAVTVTMYQLTRNTLAQNYPNVNLGRHMGRWPNLGAQRQMMMRRRAMALQGKFRQMRGQGASGNLGYIGPGRSVGAQRGLNRYM